MTDQTKTMKNMPQNDDYLQKMSTLPETTFLSSLGPGVVQPNTKRPLHIPILQRKKTRVLWWISNVSPLLFLKSSKGVAQVWQGLNYKVCSTLLFPNDNACRLNIIRFSYLTLFNVKEAEK